MPPENQYLNRNNLNKSLRTGVAAASFPSSTLPSPGLSVVKNQIRHDNYGAMIKSSSAQTNKFDTTKQTPSSRGIPQGEGEYTSLPNIIAPNNEENTRVINKSSSQTAPRPLLMKHSHSNSHPSNYVGGYATNNNGGGAFSGYGTGYPFGMGVYPSAMGMYGGMGMGMSYGPLAALSGPLSFIYNLQYFAMAIGQVFSMLGMNSYALAHMYHTVIDAIKRLEIFVRTSYLRRWLQRKCRRSQIFRFLIVFSSMAIATTITKLAKFVILHYFASLRGSGSGSSILLEGGGNVLRSYGTSVIETSE